MTLSIPVQKDKDSDLQVACSFELMYGCETWTLNSDLKRRIDAFDNKCLRWYDFVSNRRLLRETDSRPITCTVPERQLWLYGHMAHHPEVNAAHRVVSVRDNPVWRRPTGAPHNSRSWIKLTNPARSYLGCEGGRIKTCLEEPSALTS